MSFRRQVYLNPDDANKIPEIIKIQFDDTVYNIYSSCDSIKCFVCQQDGHIANVCPNSDIPFLGMDRNNAVETSGQAELHGVEFLNNPVLSKDNIDHHKIKSTTLSDYILMDTTTIKKKNLFLRTHLQHHHFK